MLSEVQVLKKLGIENFRQLSKMKVMEFASMLDKMDPEVAKKALEQFPEFAKTMADLSKDYKQSLDKIIESNKESSAACYETWNKCLDNLQNELDRGELSLDQKKYILEKMEEIADKVSDKDSENKNFFLKIMGICGAVLVATGAMIASVLGGRGSVTNNNNDSQNHNEIS